MHIRTMKLDYCRFLGVFLSLGLVLSSILIGSHPNLNIDVNAGSGAPPINGTTTNTWYVDGNVVRSNEWLNTSDIQINDSASMEWDNIIVEINGNVTVNSTGFFNMTDCVVVLNGNLTINGTATFRNVTLKMNCSYDGEYYIEVFGSMNIYDIDNDNTTLNDASVIRNGTAADNFMFWVRSGATFEMWNSRLSNCGGGGINGGLTIQASNVHIEGNTIINNYIGIRIEPWSSGNKIVNNHIQNGLTGIMIDAGQDNILDNNRISNLNYGIILFSSSATKNNITSNTIFNTSYGVFLGGAPNNFVFNNTIINNLEDGIVLAGANYNKIENNTIINQSDDGVDVDAHSFYNWIANNTINLNLYGIMVTDADNNVIYNNTCIDNINASIGLYSGSTNNEILNNNCTGSTAGIAVYQTDENYFQYNDVWSNDAGFGFVQSHRNQILNNNIKNNNNYGVIMLQSIGNIVHYNNITNNTDYGVYTFNPPHLVNATYNWWGDGSGPYHATTNPSGLGDEISNNVLYRPWGLYNVNPLIDTIDELNATEDLYYEKVYTGSDLNGDQLAWQHSDNATWLEWGAANQTLYGKPTNADVGTYWVSINLSDDADGFTVHNFTITVFNAAGLIVTSDIATATEDVYYSNDYASTDDGQGTVTWTLLTNASWLSLDANTGLLNGTPANDNVGSYWVNVSVKDGNGGLDSTNFTLTVQNTNDPPRIETIDLTFANEDEYYEVTYNATDIDFGDILTWTHSTNALWLNWGTDNHTLYGNPVNDDVGEYWIKINVSDGNGGYDEHNYNLKVNNTNDPPTIIGIPRELEIPSEQDYILDLSNNVSDIDNVSYELELLVNSKYAHVNDLIITFNYPYGFNRENVSIQVTDGLAFSNVHYIEIIVLSVFHQYPEVADYSPKGNDVDISTNITIIFSEIMNRTSVEDAFSIRPKIEGTFTWLSGDTNLRFNPISNLDYSTTYYVFIDVTIESKDGLNMLEKFDWNFTTEKSPWIDSDNDGYVDADDAFPNDPRYHADSDSDGMADWWEDQNGLNKYDPSDAVLDLDEDGRTNLEEFINDTDPATQETQDDEDMGISLLITTMIIIIITIILITLLIALRRKRHGAVKKPAVAPPQSMEEERYFEQIEE